jgi:hypothetical protein
MTLESIKFFFHKAQCFFYIKKTLLYVEGQDLSLPRISGSREEGTLAQGFLILKKPYLLNEEPLKGASLLLLLLLLNEAQLSISKSKNCCGSLPS